MIVKYSLILLGCCLLNSALAHEHKAPHAGALVELGEEFAHIELTLDAQTGKLTGYVLDGEAENAVRVKQAEIQISIKGAKPTTVTLRAVANVLTGETAGDTSEFSGQSDALKGLKEFDGVVMAITVKGKAFKDVAFNYPKGNEGPGQKPAK